MAAPALAIGSVISAASKTHTPDVAVTFKLRGMESAIANLQKLPQRINRKVLGKAMREAVKPVKKQMKKNLKEEEKSVRSSRTGVAERIKLKEINRSIGSRIRNTSKYTNNGVVYGSIGQRYDYRYSSKEPGAKWIRDRQTGESIIGTPVAGFAEMYEFEMSSYARKALKTAGPEAIKILTTWISKGTVTEAAKLARAQRTS
jgi:hypothetical protein